MRKIAVLFFILVVTSIRLSAAGTDRFRYTEATDLTMLGKVFKDTGNPYYRLDVNRYKGFTARETALVRMSSGLACAFRTNSAAISVKAEYEAPTFPTNGNGISTRGFALYIKENGKWYYAGAGVNEDSRLGEELILIDGMREGEYHDCIIYFPLYSALSSVKVGVEKTAGIEALEAPFRGRVVIFGSSFTHGSSTTDSGMSYPAQFTRNTGIQMLSLGVSGNCLLQKHFCDALCDAEDIDAFVFDAFSNPKAPMMRERLFPFIEQLQAAHPGVPLIFQRTIYRESRHFSETKDRAEAVKMATADSLMAIAVKRYKDVYYITPDATSPEHDTSVDGVHPGNKGYSLWAKSIERPILRILKKYRFGK